MFVGAGSFFNPIPTGNGLIIYSYHVTPAGRNRIKPNISALSGLLLTALPEWAIFLLNLSGHSSLYLPWFKLIIYSVLFWFETMGTDRPYFFIKLGALLIMTAELG